MGKYDEVKRLWHELEDWPYDSETECVEENWWCFPAGTHREEIWHWFEETFHVSIADLLYNIDDLE